MPRASERCSVCGQLPPACVCDLPPSWREWALEGAVIGLAMAVGCAAFAAAPIVDGVLAW